ncbi:hypothetical protein H257_04660 [Aphanomyces astaci]|uniref:Uncharacterized protein n=1 Tax=Aphanomyces astaci TaxID=112090 RepID=W4GU83_APHAT|nr:hypothetical protein H257_04660 [Aphanomyces astaci]ETV82886.1 hypothetical protein H257_04660 [Aphanomyces astaci]|eukprot:XP_009827557.1 hypothetical protein H257_04660 [Aphanomyces astaci]
MASWQHFHLFIHSPLDGYYSKGLHDIRQDGTAALTREECLDILHLLAFYKSKGDKTGGKHGSVALGRNIAAVCGVWNEYCNYGTVTQAQPAAKRRGKKAGSSCYHLSKSNVLARDSFVKVMHQFVGESPKASVVYLYELFIHQHYKRHSDSLFDPSDV